MTKQRPEDPDETARWEAEKAAAKPAEVRPELTAAEVLRLEALRIAADWARDNVSAVSVAGIAAVFEEFLTTGKVPATSEGN